MGKLGIMEVLNLPNRIYMKLLYDKIDELARKAEEEELSDGKHK